jgi:hypothetical protein
LAAVAFFHAGSVDDLILDCYRLARFYNVEPDLWLAKPLSAIRRHMVWTSKLSQKLADERRAQEEEAGR